MMRRPWAALALVAVTTLPAHALPSFAEVQAQFHSSDTLILDRQGEVVQRVRTDDSVRRGAWVGLEEVSPALRTALVLSEDQRFYEHSGVDWRAVTAAAWGNLWNTRTRGASTLTMQLAGLLDEDWRAPSGGRSVVQKLGQTVAAQVLEQRWRKDEILEAYLNLVPFRGELVGLDAMSRALFGKAPHGLDEREAAVAVALVRAPNASVAKVTQRACGVWRALHQANHPAPTAALDADTRRGPVAAAEAAAAQAVAVAPASSRVLHLTRPLPVPDTPTLLPRRPLWTADERLPAPARAEGVECDGLDVLVQGALSRRGLPSLGSSGIAPHWARRVLAQTVAPGSPAPAQIVTSLSAPLQRLAQASLQRQLRELRGRNVEDGALVVLDNASGEVLAWVGSSGELSAAAEVDGVLALRQPGSTLKPFLYAQAIAERRLTAASLLDDAPTALPTAGGLYIPQNYDHQFKGWVSVRTALAASLNIPAVRTLVMVSPEGLARQLRALGLSLKETGDYYGYSLALGSAEVPLLALTNAYRALANGGRYSPVRTSVSPPRSVPPRQTALDERAAFIVGDILSDANARVRTFGPDSVLATRFWTAVKTGTSKDMRDNWAVGWSARYTVGVWVGNASGAAMHEVSGTSGAAPVWASLMQALHAREPSRAPTPPPGLESLRVQFGPAQSTAPGERSAPLEAAREEWFLRGTAQPRFDLPSPQAQAGQRILSPSNGTILALDPDIPPAHQRLPLRSDSAQARWQIDGQALPGSGSQTSWAPWPGRHRITLVGQDGQVLDEVRVEVRGAGVREGVVPQSKTPP